MIVEGEIGYYYSTRIWERRRNLFSRKVSDYCLLLHVIIGKGGGYMSEGIEKKKKFRLYYWRSIDWSQVAGYFSHKKIACYNWL